MGTDHHEIMYLAAEEEDVMYAGGQKIAGEIISAGRDGDFSMSRRDGAVIVRCHGGTGR